MPMNTSPIPFKKVPTLNDLKGIVPKVQALFFDMDGTLFNTEEVHAQGMLVMAKKYQIRPPYSPEEVHNLMMGKADHFVFDMIKEWPGVPEHWTAQDFINEKNANVIQILKNVDHKSYLAPEIMGLLAEAKNAGLYIALITSSEKVVTQELLKIASLDSFFDLVLTRDDCPKHKPDPWPYLKALEISGKDKNLTLIFEDSSVGIEAGLKSGVQVVKAEWY